jgi:hypothetical protein
MSGSGASAMPPAVELGGLGAPTKIQVSQAPAYFFEGS